jgi:hypothetical protein
VCAITYISTVCYVYHIVCSCTLLQTAAARFIRACVATKAGYLQYLQDNALLAPFVDLLINNANKDNNGGERKNMIHSAACGVFSDIM